MGSAGNLSPEQPLRTKLESEEVVFEIENSKKLKELPEVDEEEKKFVPFTDQSVNMKRQEKKAEIMRRAGTVIGIDDVKLMDDSHKVKFGSFEILEILG